MKQLKAYEATLPISNISVISDYRYGGLTVVTFMDSLEKWFDPKEVLTKLHYSPSSFDKTITRIPIIQKILIKPNNVKFCSQKEKELLRISNRGKILVTLPVVIEMIMRSNMPNAEKYRNWVINTISFIERHGYYKDGTLSDSIDRFNNLFNPDYYNGRSPIIINQMDSTITTISLDHYLVRKIVNLAFIMTFSQPSSMLVPIEQDVNVDYLTIAYQAGGEEAVNDVVYNIQFINSKLLMGWDIGRLEAGLIPLFQSYISKFSIPNGPGYIERKEEAKEFGRCNTVLDAEYKDITEEVDNYSEEKENQKDFMKQAFRNLVVEGVILD